MFIVHKAMIVIIGEIKVTFPHLQLFRLVARALDPDPTLQNYTLVAVAVLGRR